MISFIPVLSIMGIIFLLSHTPGDQLPSSLDGLDKISHIIAYTVLGLAALFGVRKNFNAKPLQTSLIVVLFCLCYGISDEFHQSFIPLRYPSMLDIVADVTGGILAVSGWYVWTHHRAVGQQKISANTDEKKL